MSAGRVIIEYADMSEDMQQYAVECGQKAWEKYNRQQDIAASIKKKMEKKYNPTWHCCVGREIGFYVSHETRHFIYFHLGELTILLFKFG